jgi:hypothetical protein
MKACTFFTAAAFACLFVLSASSGCATAQRTDWKVLQESTYGGRFSYDRGSITRTPAGTITVKAATNGAELLYEINCGMRRARIFDRVGSAPEWFNIVTGSSDDLLYNAVCDK